MDETKRQADRIPEPADLGEDVIVSPDTRRHDRLPPNQQRTKKWPVLDAHGAPTIERKRWKLDVTGLVSSPQSLTWEEYRRLPRTKVFADMHCVTRWSRLGNVWEGVSARTILDLAGVEAGARFAIAHGYDRGFTTNLPIEAFREEDVLLADTHDGEPISLEHGGPLRLVVPRLYAWKSAKWLAEIELVAEDRAGYWEQAGYHPLGDPWQEQRFR